MDAPVKKPTEIIQNAKGKLKIGKGPQLPKPSREDAMEAVRTLIKWAGDDPSRDGLIDTPRRVVDAYDEFFQGYDECPIDILSRTFEEPSGYDDIVLLRDIDLNSHCEHHMIPFIGKAHVAYYPTDRVVGISKLARVIEVFSRRLQTQETMTAQIAQSIDEALESRGTAVMIEAVHQCMSLRGVQKPNVSTITTQYSGIFKDEPELQTRFLTLVRNGS